LTGEPALALGAGFHALGPEVDICELDVEQVVDSVEIVGRKRPDHEPRCLERGRRMGGGYVPETTVPLHSPWTFPSTSSVELS
jgi:hypothetical protein